jgi:alkylhydroperoxidase family enzyme
MSRQPAQGANVAGLQALLSPTNTGKPRIAPAHPRELGPLARIVAEVAGRASASGPPNIFTTLGQHPRLFRAWLRYSAHLMPFGKLPRRDTELVILRVAWQCRSAYARGHHYRRPRHLPGPDSHRQTIVNSSLLRHTVLHFLMAPEQSRRTT